MGHPSSVHFESFEGPVSGGDGPHEAGRDEIPSELHSVEGVELGRAGRFFEDLVDAGLQCHIEGLEKVFKQQRE